MKEMTEREKQQAKFERDRCIGSDTIRHFGT